MRAHLGVAWLFFLGCGRCGLPSCEQLLAASLPDGGTSAPVDASTFETISGTVQDERGPRDGVVVRLVQASPAPCPCEDEPDAPGLSNGCACAASLARHRQRRARCPNPVLAETRSVDGGAWSLPAAAGGTLVEAVAPGLVRWQPLEGARSEVSLELLSSRDLHLTVKGTADPRTVTATALFENGLCAPFGREGSGFVARGLALEEGTVLVEAPGFTPVELAVGEEPLTATLRPWVTVSERCLADDERASEAAPFAVRWRGLYERRETTTDAEGQFRFEGMLATPAEVECRKGTKLVSQFTFEPEEGELVRLGNSSTGEEEEDEPHWKPGQDHARCAQVQVVDQNDRPLAGAKVLIGDLEPEGQPVLRSFEVLETNAQGLTCSRRLLYGGLIDLRAPDRLGGPCAGQAEVRVAPWEPESNLPPKTRAVLPVSAPTSAWVQWRGRVVSGTGVPLARARVDFASLSWTQGDRECSVEGPEAVETRADGTFETPSLPRGELRLTVSHAWYTRRELTVPIPGPSQDIALERGSSWTGHLLDPLGAPITQARLRLTDAVGRTEHRRPGPEGQFSFSALASGEAHLVVSLEEESPWGRRILETRRMLGAQEAVSADVRLPGGGAISGRVVHVDGGATSKYVLAMPDDGRPTFEDKVTTQVAVRLDGDGRFEFRALGPGKWRLRAYAASRWVLAEPGQVNVLVPAR